MYLDLLPLGTQSGRMYSLGLQWDYHVDEDGLKYLYSWNYEAKISDKKQIHDRMVCYVLCLVAAMSDSLRPHGL